MIRQYLRLDEPEILVRIHSGFITQSCIRYFDDILAYEQSLNLWVDSLEKTFNSASILRKKSSGEKNYRRLLFVILLRVHNDLAEKPFVIILSSIVRDSQQ